MALFDVDPGIPGKVESVHHPLDDLGTVERQDSQVVSSLVCHVGRQLQLNMTLLWLPRCSKNSDIFDDSFPYILAKIVRAGVGGDFDVEALAFRGILVLGSVLYSNARPKSLIDPLVEIVENVVIGGVSIASCGESLTAVFVKEIVDGCGDLLKRGLPVA